ncbi:hypothetical protein COOONC_00613 [Cooperia oncophora]
MPEHAKGVQTGIVIHPERLRNIELEASTRDMVKGIFWSRDLRVNGCKAREEEVRLPKYGWKLSSLDFVIENGQLMLISEEGSFLPIVPQSRRHEVFKEAHNGALGGHFHARKMYDQLSKTVFWPRMYRDLVRWCRECLFDQQ